jgi:hypothetical protein
MMINVSCKDVFIHCYTKLKLNLISVLNGPVVF